MLTTWSGVVLGFFFFHVCIVKKVDMHTWQGREGGVMSERTEKRTETKRRHSSVRGRVTECSGVVLFVSLA